MQYRNIAKIQWLIVFCLTILMVLPSFSQTKHALIVAIGKYASADIPEINSLNDIPFIQKALLTNGFEAQNIMSLTNEKATKEKIVDAIRIELMSKLLEGDVVVLHFSTHGVGIKDDSGDEADGYDETIVCYNTPYNLPKEYKGQKHLLDDELSVLLTELRQKVGNKGQVLLLVDACYSGTISRGNDRFRSFVSPDNDKKLDNVSKAKKSNKNTSGIRDAQSFKDEKLAPCIVISASAQDEVNGETTDIQGNPVGSLSYAFSKAMQHKQKNANYKLLFDCIKSEMAIIVPRQTPQLEGDWNQPVFSADLLSMQTQVGEYFAPKKYLNDTVFVLNAGGLAEIFEGTTLELFQQGVDTKEINLCMASGKVISATEFESKVLLSKSLTENQIMQANVVITSRSFAGLHQKVLLSVKNSEKIEALLANEKIIQFVKPEAIFSADLLVEERKLSKTETQLLFLYKNTEDTVFVNLTDTKPESIAEILKNKVMAYAKSNYLRAISQLNPNLNVELKIIPIKYIETEDKIEITEKFDEKSLISDGGQLFLKEGSVFILRAINKGSEKAYLSIINIQPDNNITLLVPDENRQAENLFLNPNDSIDFEEYIFQVSPPYGADMLKLIASQKPMPNLKLIFGNTQNRSLSRTTQANSPFEVLMNETMNTSSRSLKKVNVPANDINACTKIIQGVR